MVISHSRVQSLPPRDLNCLGDQRSADALPTFVDVQGEDLTLGAGHHVREHTDKAAVTLSYQRRVIERMLQGAATSDAQRVPAPEEARQRLVVARLCRSNPHLA